MIVTLGSSPVTFIPPFLKKRLINYGQLGEVARLLEFHLSCGHWSGKVTTALLATGVSKLSWNVLPCLAADHISTSDRTILEAAAAFV